MFQSISIFSEMNDFGVCISELGVNESNEYDSLVYSEPIV